MRWRQPVFFVLCCHASNRRITINVLGACSRFPREHHGKRLVPRYDFHIIDADRSFTRVIDRDMIDDASAESHAQRLLADEPKHVLVVEVWQRDRLVCRVTRSDRG
jgi:hypothetical protein